MAQLLSGDMRASLLQRARRALEEERWFEAAADYRVLLEPAQGDAPSSELRRALWIEHAGFLAAQGRLEDAAALLRAYMHHAQALGDTRGLLPLHVLLAEVQASRERWGECRRSLAEARALLEHPAVTSVDRTAVHPALLRLAALDIAVRGDRERAASGLAEARAEYAARGDDRGVRVVDGDLRRLALGTGDAEVIGEVLEQVGAASTAEVLLQARALRRDARYEAAVQLLLARLNAHVEPALRFPLLHELLLMHLLLADWQAGERLMPLLREAAGQAGDPQEAGAALDRLCGAPPSKSPAGAEFDEGLYRAREQVRRERFAEAAALLDALWSQTAPAHRATGWSFASGELAFALGRRAQGTDRDRYAEQALEHLGRATWLAWRHSFPEVYGEAVRLLGRVHAVLRGDARAAEAYWARAGTSDETVAHRQETDTVRLRFLESRPSAFDERVEAAAARSVRDGGHGVALPIAAIEEARGSAILSLILPATSARPRVIPPQDDVDACWEWCRGLALGLPGNLAVWLLHATPGRLHHGIVARGVVHASSVALDRQELSGTIAALADCWRHGFLLEQLVATQPDRIPGLLRALSAQLQSAPVLAALPERITRLAVVAGGALGDIPFCALPLAGSGGAVRPLVARFAVSRQPCLSTWPPLAARSRGGRGDTGLHVRPPGAGLGGGLGGGEPDPRLALLEGANATIPRMLALLNERSFPLLQIDCHGQYDEDRALESWLELAPEEDGDGRLTARRFQEFPLAGCGTLLLGACESGMSQPAGRDERIGFVRAAMAAGASSVLAAQWVAEDSAATFILTRFRRYLRFLPRDVALQRAQVEFLDLPPGHDVASRLNDPRHPAWWACWNLHGDPGLQTRANPLLRVLRRAVAAVLSTP